MTKKVFWTVATLVLIIVVIALAAYFWLNNKPSKNILLLEKAIATDRLVGLAFYDHSQLMAMLGLVKGKPDPAPLPIPGIDTDLIEKLLYGEANFRENLDQATFWLEALPENPGIFLALSGQFNWQYIEPVLSDAYLLSPLTKYTYRLDKKRDENKTVCAGDQGQNQDTSTKQETFLYADAEWLLLSDNLSNLDNLIERLNGKVEISRDLSQWDAYRKGKLFSMAVFSPENIAKSVGGIPGYMADEVVQSNPEVKSWFAGVSVDLLKAGLLLHSRINADSDWASRWHKKINQQLAAKNREITTVSPTLGDFISGIEVREEAASLHISAPLKNDTLASIPDMMGEVIGYAFSGQLDGEQDQTREERVNETPWDFANNVVFGSLTKYRVDGNNRTPVFTGGPFAIDFIEAEWDAKTGLTQIKVKAEVKLPEVDGSWFDAEAEFQLLVDSVKDRSGKEMLRDEVCLDNIRGFGGKNREPAKGFNVSNNLAHIEKIIRLQSGLLFNSIDHIEGRLKFAAPVEVVKAVVDLVVGTTIEKAKVRIFVNKVEKQSVTYQVSGKRHKFIGVRALNLKGETLRRGTQFSSGSDSSNDRTTTTQFMGDIHRLEFYFAKTRAVVDFDYTLDMNRFYSLVEQNHEEIPTAVVTGAVAESEWQRFSNLELTDPDRTKAFDRIYSSGPLIGSHNRSPVWMAFHQDIESSWDNALQVNLIVPLIPQLVGNRSAFELTINDQNRSVNQFFSFSPGRYNESGQYAPAVTVKDLPLMSGKANPKLKLKIGQKLSELKGELTVRLPHSVSKTEFPFPDLGQSKSIGDSQVTFGELDAGFIPRLKVRYQGPLDKFINLLAKTADGKIVSPVQSDLEENTWTIQFDLRSDLKTLILLTTDQQTQINYPFDLNLTY